MKLYGYSYYNKLVGAFTAPQFINIDKDVKKEADQRAFLMSDKKEQATMKEHDLYYLGEFDDKSGSMKLSDKPEFVCSFNGGNLDE